MEVHGPELGPSAEVQSRSRERSLGTESLPLLFSAAQYYNKEVLRRVDFASISFGLRYCCY